MAIWTPQEATNELMSLLPIINRLMAAELRLEAGENTTMPQFRVMAYLFEQPLTLSVIARRRRVSLQSAGELVQSLVERGWIERVPDPYDRRQSLLHLTELGRESYERTERRMQERLLPFISKLSAEEMAAVQLAIPALHRALDEGLGDDSD